MDMRARDMLGAVVARFGEGIVRDPHRFEGALRDACGDRFRREARVLVLAVRDGIAGELLEARNDPYPELLLARLSSRLEDVNSLEASAARWSVESLALALNVAVPVPRVAPATPVRVAPALAPAPARVPAAAPAHVPAPAPARLAAPTPLPLRAPTPSPSPSPSPSPWPAPSLAPAPSPAPTPSLAPAPAPSLASPPARAPSTVQAPARPPSARGRNTVLLVGGVIVFAAWAYSSRWLGAIVPAPAGEASAPREQLPAPALPATTPGEPPTGAASTPDSAGAASPVDPGPVKPTDAPRRESPSPASAGGPPAVGLPGTPGGDASPVAGSPDVRILVQKAESALREGAVDAADAYVKAALAVEPDNSEAKRLGEQILARKTRDQG